MTLKHSDMRMSTETLESFIAAAVIVYRSAAVHVFLLQLFVLLRLAYTTSLTCLNKPVKHSEAFNIKLHSARLFTVYPAQGND